MIQPISNLTNTLATQAVQFGIRASESEQKTALKELEQLGIHAAEVNTDKIEFINPPSEQPKSIFLFQKGFKDFDRKVRTAIKQEDWGKYFIKYMPLTSDEQREKAKAVSYDGHQSKPVIVRGNRYNLFAFSRMTENGIFELVRLLPDHILFKPAKANK